MLPYRKLGNGPDLAVLIHGWLSDSRVWAAMEPSFDGERWTWVIPDLPGNGQARKMAGAGDLAECTQQLLALLDHFHASRAAFVGHSLGAQLVQWMASYAPERIDKQVLIAPVPATGIEMPDYALEHYESAVFDDKALHQVIDYLGGGHLRPDVFAQLSKIARSACGTKAGLAWLAAFTKTSDFATVPDLAGVRTLVILGENDPAITKELMAKTIYTWGSTAQTVIVPECSHYSIVERPSYVARLLQTFLTHEPLSSGLQ